MSSGVFKGQEAVETQQVPDEVFTIIQKPPDDFEVQQYDIGNASSTNVMTTAPSNTVAVRMSNIGDDTVFFNNDGVTTVNDGSPILAGTSVSIEVAEGQDIFLQANSGTQDVRVLYFIRDDS